MLATIKERKSHRNCIMCGPKNPASFHLKFKRDSENTVYADFSGTSIHQGYTGIMHGGVTSALLDSAMTNCLFAKDIEAVTADLKIRFLKPIPFHAPLHITAELVLERYPLYRLKSEILVNGLVCARAEAKFMDLRFLGN